MSAVDAYLAGRGLWGDVQQQPQDFSFTKFHASLVQSRRLTPAQVGEMTLQEALLYTVSLEETKTETSVATAMDKLKVIATLPVGDHLALARIRCGRG